MVLQSLHLRDAQRAAGLGGRPRGFWRLFPGAIQNLMTFNKKKIVVNTPNVLKRMMRNRRPVSTSGLGNPIMVEVL
jgi:hypothetical protein